MNIQVKRPDVKRIIGHLKDFQKRSADKVYRRLYLDNDYTNRFLIADEVGLGKTLVARGVIAKGIDYLWEKGVERIDVIYICANRDIASQNINRLNVTESSEFSMASRLTMLPLKISGLKDNKLNFISFTPGTSFNLHSQAGIKEERALIYHMLRAEWGLYRMGPINLFQDWVSKENWRELVSKFEDWYSIDSELAEKFINEVNKKIEEEKRNGKKDIKTRFFELCERFKVFKKNVPEKDRQDARELIGELRLILANSCLDALEPDIVILDEFQRFKHLLDGKGEMGKLAKHMFNYKNPDGEVKIIMLSATPYKMYTVHGEEDVENHYEDFIRTVNFLYGDDKDKTEQFERKLRCYRNELLSVRPHSLNTLREIKKEIEDELKKVMIRTERLASTPDRNGMIKEKDSLCCRVKITDLDDFAAVDKLSQELDSCDMVEYWKSAPYLLNFMEDYDLKRKFKKKVNDGEISSSISSLLKKYKKNILKWKTIKNYEQMEPANAKMRTLIQNGLDKESWKLLWIPSSLPYYKHYGNYGKKELQDYTKSLIFSSWQVVPKAIASICSYEAERRQVQEFMHEELKYDLLHKKRSPLLVFREKDGWLSGMGNLTLMYPCMTLVEAIDPLGIALELLPKDGPPSFKRIYAEVKKRVEKLLNTAAGHTEIKRGIPDESWYWAALALMDRKFHYESLGKWFKTGNSELKWETIIKSRIGDKKETHFKKHIEKFTKFFYNPEELGRKPKDLVEVLAKLALASPAVVAARSMLRLKGQEEEFEFPLLLFNATKIASGFRGLFNLPDTIALVRSGDDKNRYWEQVLDYSLSGNIQSVMDEYIHILNESLGLFDRPFNKKIDKIGDEIYSAVSIRTVSMSFDEIEVDSRKEKIQINNKRIRCRYALRFGEEKREGEEEITRANQVRASFNSPFRPFLLATTSIGQEGLDFHQYCHSIYHWNLPSNPVDLEQREGRIHRYKGLVIRRNLAKHFGLDILKENYRDFGKEINDPWDFLFSKGVAIRKDDEDDIVPFWIFETKNGLKIDRNIPCLPMSRDIERLRDLKRTLVMYRMVFGQPRQEDLIEFLKKHMDQKEIKKEMQNFSIDLSPR